jgi:thiamine-phosphate pyrophosphorylase
VHLASRRRGAPESWVDVTPPRLFLVTDPAYTFAHIETVISRMGDALPGGSFGVQLRDKSRARDDVRAFAERLRALTFASAAPLLVNRDLGLARETRADGVHLGKDARALGEARLALPGAWISVAAHSDADVERALRGGADAVFVSPIYETPGKGSPRGLRAIERAKSIGGDALAVYALGGVTAARARACREAGATGVAVIRAILGAPDPIAEAQRILAEL